MAGTWIAHTPTPGDQPHLIPIGDVIQHLAHTDCICGPTLHKGEWVHHALNRMSYGD